MASARVMGVGSLREYPPRRGWSEGRGDTSTPSRKIEGIRGDLSRIARVREISVSVSVATRETLPLSERASPHRGNFGRSDRVHFPIINPRLACYACDNACDNACMKMWYRVKIARLHDKAVESACWQSKSAFVRF